jgi:hypothetical protein
LLVGKEIPGGERNQGEVPVMKKERRDIQA